MRFLIPLALLCCACGSSPTAPSIPTATLIDGGALTVAGCTPMESGAYECAGFSGTLTNQGPGCASQVSGTTITYGTDKRTPLTTVQWGYPSVVKPNETITYTGLHVTIASHDGWTYRTSPHWQDVTCP